LLPEKEKILAVATPPPLELENWLEKSHKTEESKEFLFEISSLLEANEVVNTTKSIKKELPQLVFEETKDYTAHLKSLFEAPSDDHLFENLTAFEQGIPFGEEADAMESLWMPIEEELPMSTSVAIHKPQIVFNENATELPIYTPIKSTDLPEMLPIIENKIVEKTFSNSEWIDNQSFENEDALDNEEDSLENNHTPMSEEEAIEDLIAEFKTMGLNKNLSETHSITPNKSEETEMKAKPSRLIARDPVDFNEWLQQYPQNVPTNHPKPTLISNPSDKLSEKQTVVEWSEWVGTPTTKSKNGGENEKKKRSDMPPFLTKSLKRREDIASETLADLLANQGNVEQAIKMYEVLCLENPDKNRFFAQKIQLLKEHLKK
jgi:hypothetical protein